MTVRRILENDKSCRLGARMRKVKEIREGLQEHADVESWQEVYPEDASSKAPAPQRVKDVWVGERRYILCYNSRQARKNAADRQAILKSCGRKWSAIAALWLATKELV